jgi:hypothetical protein
MKPLNLGKTADGNFSIDLPKLIETRAFIQANSGGGKSWLLRLLAEKAMPTTQTIILDPEGEFATLREKHDLILVGREGEVPADTRTAATLARELAKLGASAVLDLYDLSPANRQHFARLFLEALLDIPKNLYHPMIVMIDEAHRFCPEKGTGESAATEAVINILAQGRKRGICGIPATQRLSKLHKNAESECNNVFIGRTVQDVDQDRAVKVLGINRNDRLQLRDMVPGEFFAFGPAIPAAGVTRFTAGSVETTHPKAGHGHQIKTPKASDAVKALLAGLADLPKVADEEARTMAEAKKQIAELHRQLRARPKEHAEKVVEKRVEVPALKAYQLKRLENSIEKFQSVATGTAGVASGIQESLRIIAHRVAPAPKPLPTLPPHLAHITSTPRPVTASRPITSPTSPPSSAGGIGKSGKRRILIALAQHPDGLTKRKLSLLTGISAKGGTWRTYLADLRGQSFVVGSDHMKITGEGVSALGAYEPLPTGTALVDYWRGELGDSGKRKLFDAIVGVYPAGMAAADIEQITGIARSGGTWRTYMAELRGLELISGRDELRASDELFEG